MNPKIGSSAAITGVAGVFATVACAYAASPVQCQTRDLVMLVFLGFCALVCVGQLLYAVKAVYVMIKSVTGKSTAASPSKAD
jgi:hypothetical protein